MGIKVREKTPNSNIYYLFINYKKKRVALRIGSKEDAEKAAIYLQEKINSGRLDLNKLKSSRRAMPKLGPYSEYVIDSLYDPETQSSTNERYKLVRSKDIVNTDLHSLDKKFLDEITPHEIWTFLNKLVDLGRAPKSIELTRTVLSCCFKHAKMEKFISENPLKEIPRLKKRKAMTDDEIATDKINPFSREQRDKFIELSMKESPDMYGPLIMTLFKTGLRLGEILALRWEDINWEKGTIYINKTYKRGEQKPTKMKRSRHVDLSYQLFSELKKLYEKRKDECSSVPIMAQIIFGYKGHFRAQNTVRKAYKKLLKKAALPDKRIHDTRHTYATLLLSNNASIAYIKDQLGHKKIQTTLDYYGKYIPGANRDMVSKLDSPET
ncbi:integrase [Desulfuromusa kysingii]|uniref:Integrase n=1 Tax=Desulfuromusa kysingii TaxID=37625 RepID=A0A1H4D6E7_9BACT|nr:site-specific integrase [Desulfuromusa kysingii]SEA68138.1 integrase [Desulfuromusa kysingii]